MASLRHTAESIDRKLDLIDENKNLLPYPYVTDFTNYDVLEDVGDGSILTKEKIGGTDIEILLKDFQLPAGKKYVISLNITNSTDILENAITVSGCKLIIKTGNKELATLDSTSGVQRQSLDLSNESGEKAILVYLIVPAGADKGLLIKPQIEEYKTDIEPGVWAPYMKTIGNYVDERFNNTNAKLKVLSKLLGLPDCSEYSDGSTLVVKDGVWTIDATSLNGLIYTLNNDGESYSVTGIRSCEDTDIVIPAKYKGGPVTGIGEEAFEGCTSLTSVAIPDSVTEIGTYAFYGCTNLTSVDIPYDASFGSGVFAGCTSLTSAIINGDSQIISNTYQGCTALTNIVFNNVTTIGSSAFRDCTGLTSVTIPDSVTTIGDWAFANCTSLTSVTIPNSVIYITSDAFRDCTSLTDVYYTGTEDEWNAISIGSNNEPLINANIYFESAFGTCGEQDDNLTWKLDGAGTLTIRGEGEMRDCIDGMFCLWGHRNRSSIKSIVIGDSVTTIGDWVFYDCDNLTSVAIPNSVTTIGDWAFSYCDNLTSVTIGDSVTTIGEVAFQCCKKLTSVDIGDSVTFIGNQAFNGCTSLTSVDIPDSVTKIGRSAFANCTSLTSVTIPDSVTGISDRAFCNCKNLTSVTIGDSVTTIGEMAFAYCTSLTSVEIGDSVTSIGEKAFFNCTSLTSVDIPDSVTSIGSEAFRDCTSLTSVDIPDSVTTISNYTFSNCTSLTDIYCAFTQAVGEEMGAPWGAENVTIQFTDVTVDY